VPSPPLLLPSTDHRSDILKVDMASRKRVNYKFIDTVDASIQASESRVMTAVEEDDRALLRAQISLFTREMRYFRSIASSHEREVVYVRQAWSRLEDRSTSLEASIRTLEAQEHEANRSKNKDDSHDSRSGERRTVPTTRYTQHFQELALMCGRMFPKESDEVEKYVDGLPDMIQAKNKRKLDDNSRNNHTQQQPQKRQNVASVYTTRPGKKREYGGSLPLCTKYNYHHNGQCAPKCNNYKKVGHLARDCRSPAASTNNQRAPRVIQRVVTCFECGV
nr:hypothetical protein [Tanacetum cinerariifolium]